LKAVFFVKPDRPDRVRPSSDQYRGARQSPQVRKQLRSNSSLVAVSANIGVPNWCHILNLLNAHYGRQRSGLLVAPEHNTFVDLTQQFLAGHVRFCPAISRDYSFVSLAPSLMMAQITSKSPSPERRIMYEEPPGLGVS
jgi:hypothetical protein